MEIHRLTQAGEALVSSFVNRHAAYPQEQNLGSWFVHAELIADDAEPWESIVLEMPADMTASGRPETIKIYRSLFDVKTIDA